MIDIQFLTFGADLKGNACELHLRLQVIMISILWLFKKYAQLNGVQTVQPF